MSKETLKNLIELVPEKDIDILYQVVIKFIPEVPAEPGEIEAFAEARANRAEHGTISHDAIDWD